MSANRRNGSGFNPSSEPSKLTIDDVAKLKKVLSDSGLSKWIIMAGIGAVLESLHILWLAARFVFKF